MADQSKPVFFTHERSGRLAQIVVAGLVLVTLAAMIVAPFNALRFARQPFPGVFFEPTLDVTDANDPAWEGVRQGLAFPDHLVSINNVPVGSTRDLESALARRKLGERVTLSIVTRAGQTQQVSVTLTRFP